MHDTWKDMFVMGLPLAEKILRPIIVYAFLVVSLRLSGKRELVQLNPFDLVVLLTLSNTVQNAIIGEDNSVLGGIIGATSLLLTNYLVVRFLYDHRKLDQLVEGRADVLVEGGKVRTRNLKRELITVPQLEAALLLCRNSKLLRGSKASLHSPKLNNVCSSPAAHLHSSERNPLPKMCATRNYLAN